MLGAASVAGGRSQVSRWI